MHEGARAVVWTSLALAASALGPAVAHATVPNATHPAAGPARVARPTGSAGAPRAPTGPPLVSGPTPAAGTEEALEAGGPQPGEVDPLVGNGLGSPLCRGILATAELARANRRDCQTSGFVAAPAPTGDYGLDVHIDTGFLGLSTGHVLSIVQDLFVQPLWMAIVWAVHALIVMLEWGFTIDLLDSPGVRESVAAGLQRMQVAVTVPWLALALSCAAVLAVYNGLIRRRVGETLAQALALVAMIVAGMWVTVDPTGTVGAVGGWANQASLGTLATAARGAPTGAGNALASSMSDVFATAVELPWCYLEFGDVSWCRDPARLDPDLHAAALRISGEELAQAGCAHVTGACGTSSSRESGLEHSAQLLQEARTNGAIFLALPANGRARNSINDTGSLLRIMCRSSEATACHGPLAAAAEFRTDGGTWPRVGGLLLIAAGLAGMLLTLGFIAARLLAAALFSLLYLLMAPAVMLAPAFGDRGRALFARWATQLFAAVISKLLFSFVLGVMLAVAAILSGLARLGFWTQWLVLSVFWWGAWARREHILALVGGGSPLARGSPRSPLARRLRHRTPSIGAPLAGAKRALATLAGSGPTFEHQKQITAATRMHARDSGVEQVARSLENDRRGARLEEGAESAIQGRVSELQDQLARVRSARSHAATRGDRRRGVELAHRAARIERDLGDERQRLTAATHAQRGATTRARRASVASLGFERAERARFLDEQAALPASRDAAGVPPVGRRDYASLAGLAGFTAREYEALDPARRRRARLDVDRELALLREISVAAGDVVRATERNSINRRARRSAENAFERTLADRMRAAGEELPVSRTERSAVQRWRSEGRASALARDRSSSRVMDDARAVAERRKRQLGFDRD